MTDYSYIPEPFHSVTPSLTVNPAAEAIDFYMRAFGAEEIYRLKEPDSDKVMHAEIKIGNSVVMLSDEYPDWGAVAPPVGKGAKFMIYVPNADEAYARAIEAGATEIMAVEDMFYGDRTGVVADPYGYRWTLAQRVRNMSPEEIEEATKQWQADCGPDKK